MSTRYILSNLCFIVTVLFLLTMASQYHSKLQQLCFICVCGVVIIEESRPSFGSRFWSVLQQNLQKLSRDAAVVRWRSSDTDNARCCWVSSPTPPRRDRTPCTDQRLSLDIGRRGCSRINCHEQSNGLLLFYKIYVPATWMFPWRFFLILEITFIMKWAFTFWQRRQ